MRMWTFQKGNQKLLPPGLLDTRRLQTIRHQDCDSHHQSFSTGGHRLTVKLSFTELAKLWSVVLDLPPLLKTRLEEFRTVLPRQEVPAAPQCPAINTSTHPSAAPSIHRTFSSGLAGAVH